MTETQNAADIRKLKRELADAISRIRKLEDDLRRVEAQRR